ncbi:diacylglycerol kinase family protein [Pontibacillus marinus]|uniref:Diacylglycerol kinase n=1 Tax=Pontibacillus marinus BH030004 = DSM 16465 TaxID=1385511 RepID=A0A0A5FS02_9BACI|nr:diacylglycerol kinase family protein [Pontibacillus marinus]KGX83516.1 hypothetical protein N783_02890 [Pontibacillus marinus BH030004 = DSM 16465]
MPLDSKEGKKKLIGFSFAFNGIKEIIKSERNFRIHLITTFIIVLMGLFFNIQPYEWISICLVVSLVLILEMINSAIERIMDFLSPDRHTIVGQIKDITAGSVLVAAITSAVIGAIIFLPKIMNLLGF